MLTVHHLGRSQSERIVWLCEELAIPYELVIYDRDPVTRLAPPELRALHPTGTAPVITDGELTLGESGAIVEYIIGRYGHGRLAVRPAERHFAPYLFWFHFANGNLQAHMGRNMLLNRLDLAEDDPVKRISRERLERSLALVESRLGEASYFAGETLTAADIMMVFSLTTMRLFLPMDLSPYPNMRAYLARIGERAAYREAMHKGDPGFTPMLS